MLRASLVTLLCLVAQTTAFNVGPAAALRVAASSRPLGERCASTAMKLKTKEEVKEVEAAQDEAKKQFDSQVAAQKKSVRGKSVDPKKAAEAAAKKEAAAEAKAATKAAAEAKKAEAAAAKKAAKPAKASKPAKPAKKLSPAEEREKALAEAKAALEAAKAEKAAALAEKEAAMKALKKGPSLPQINPPSIKVPSIKAPSLKLSKPSAPAAGDFDPTNPAVAGLLGGLAVGFLPASVIVGLRVWITSRRFTN